MDKTRLTGLEVAGPASFAGEAEFGGGIGGVLTGAIKGVYTKSTAADLSVADKAIYYGITLTAASKTVTLGADEGQVCFVHNAGGTNAFTLKNVSGDSGTSIGAGKIAIVAASKTANKSVVLVLN